MRNHHQGQVMLLTVVLLSGAILSATSLAGLLVLYQLHQATDVIGSTQAIFAADSGVECVLFQNFKDKAKDCSTGVLGNGTSFKTVPIEEGGIRSVGMAGRTARAFKFELTTVEGEVSPPPEFGDGSLWAEATSSALWSPRINHASVVFKDKIWVIGGGNKKTGLKSDVWYSSDGINWIEATSAAPWDGREYHTSVVFKDKIWVIGGGDGGGRKADVWYSTNGVDWTSAILAAPWEPRLGHTSVVFKDKIWVIGGVTDKGYKNDVWSSSDGVNWDRVISAAPWFPRYGHSSVVYNDEIWVMGGVNFEEAEKGDIHFRSDVWRSDNGFSWFEATPDAPWGGGYGRYAQTSVVYDDKMWVIGGLKNGFPQNDVWYSTDGASWAQAAVAALWSPRYAHTSIVYNNKMWVMGGHNFWWSDSQKKSVGEFYNDVWYTLP